MTPRTRGAALLMSLLTAAVVATLAATALSRYSHMVEMESTQRQRAQMAWLLQGALDWARLILQEDAKANRKESADHLNEPWAMPLQEAKLSTFLAAQDESSGNEVSTEAFLSGYISDAQSRFNLANLRNAADTDWSAADVAAFIELCEGLRLDPEVWLQAIERQSLDRQSTASNPGSGGAEGVFKWRLQRIEDLANWGVPLAHIAALSPHIDWLPKRTPVNVNTASARVLRAAWSGLGPSQAQQVINARALKPFTRLQDLQEFAPQLTIQSTRLSTTSDYFWVTGRLRLDETAIIESSLVVRDGLNTKVVRRQRQATQIR